MCIAQYGCFCSSLISCFPGMLLRYCLSDFEMVPVVSIITGITYAFTFPTNWISVTRSLYFKNFSAFITFSKFSIIIINVIIIIIIIIFWMW
jgi:hypothetical protein